MSIDICFVETNVLDNQSYETGQTQTERKQSAWEMWGRRQRLNWVLQVEREWEESQAKGQYVRKDRVARITMWLHCGWKTWKKCWRLSSIANWKGPYPTQLATGAHCAPRNQLWCLIGWSVSLAESQRSAERSKTKNWLNPSRKRGSNPSQYHLHILMMFWRSPILRGMRLLLWVHRYLCSIKL